MAVAWIAMAFMVLMATAAGWREAIFPEAAALITGLCIVDKRVWIAPPYLSIFLFTLVAASGVAMVRYLHCPLWGQLIVVFFMVAALLTLTRTTIRPLFSAGLLPVMLQTHSWSYPLAVLVITASLFTLRGLMECWQLLEPLAPACYAMGRRQRGKRWVLVGGVASFIMVLFIKAGWCYCLLPPLIVAYVEFCNSDSGFRQRPFSIWATLVAATAASSWLQYSLVSMDLPACWGALAALLLLFAYFHRSGKFFAPAAALTILPLLLPFPILPQLPLMVAVGAAVLIAAALWVGHLANHEL